MARFVLFDIIFAISDKRFAMIDKSRATGGRNSSRLSNHTPDPRSRPSRNMPQEVLIAHPLWLWMDAN